MNITTEKKISVIATAESCIRITTGTTAATYTVQSGDSLNKISDMYYSRTGYAPVLAAYNEIPDPDHVIVGHILKIPILYAEVTSEGRTFNSWQIHPNSKGAV